MEGMETPFLSPSILSCDLADIKTALASIEKGGKAVHIDVMDGVFVPQITYGQCVVRSMRKYSSLPFDVHLMTQKPEEKVETFAEAGADWMTFHLEACTHAHRLVGSIHEHNMKAGIAIVPSTPVCALEELLPIVDIVLVMTVNPGYGGQKIIPSCLDKVRRLKKQRTERGLSFLISIDGGVNEGNIKEAENAGADVIVSGSAFFEGRLGGVAASVEC